MFQRMLYVAAFLSAQLLGAVGSAQDQKATFVVPIPQKIVDGLKYVVVGSAGEQKIWDDRLYPVLESFFPGVNLQGQMRVDVRFTEGQDYRYVLYVPVSNTRKFISDNLEPSGITVRPSGQGLYKLGSAFTGVMRTPNGYGWIAEKDADIATNQPDPIAEVKVLAALNADLIANIANDPGTLDQRRKAFGKVRENVLAALRKKPTESTDEFELRKLAAQQQMDLIQNLLVEAAEFRLTWRTDSQKNEGEGLLLLSALPDTALAKTLAMIGPTASYFAGVPKDEKSVFSGRLNLPFEEEQKAKQLEVLQRYRKVAAEQITANKETNDGQKKARNEVLNAVLDMIESGIQQLGRIDGFLEITPTGSGKHMAVFGIRAVDGTAANKIVELLPGALTKGTVEKNVAKEGAVEIHKVEAETKNSATLKEFFGTTTVYVGTSPEAVWISIGEGALDGLKGAVVKQGSPKGDAAAEPFGYLRAQVRPLLDLSHKLSGTEGNVKRRELALKSLQTQEGSVEMWIKKVDDHVEGRTHASAGILRVAGKIIAQFALDNL